MTTSPANNRASCRADTVGAVTSNSSLKFFLGKSDISELMALTESEKIVSDRSGYVGFQQATPIESYAQGATLTGRTLEETFIYQNIEIFSENKIPSGIVFSGVILEDHEAVYQAIRCSSFKKTEFALDVISTTEDWKTPVYILEGLRWLTSKTCRDVVEEVAE